METKAFGLVRVFADARGESIQDLKDRLQTLVASSKSILEKAAGESRELTPEEEKEVQGYHAAFEQTEVNLVRRERQAEMEARLNAAEPRRAAPPPIDSTPSRVPLTDTTSSTRAPITGDDLRAQNPTGGFRHFGEFAAKVRAAIAGRVEDPRLRIWAAVSSSSSEGVGADGGYLVPPDFRTSIMEKVQGEDSLVQLTDQQTTSSNAISFVTDETTPWQTSGGIQVTWEGEGTVIGQSKVAINTVLLRILKLAALLPVTDELLEDSAALNAYMSRKVPVKMTAKLNDALVAGTGVGMPMGILNAACLVTQAAEGSQTADTINFLNIVKMYSRMESHSRRNAVWIMNQDIEPQLASLVIPAASGVSSPAYLPAGSGLTQAPNGTLMGRPIFFTEAASALGDVGDIIFADMKQYCTVQKSSGMKADSSIHLWFDQGVVAFRFILRIGGAPYWASSITTPHGNTRSCFVTLASR